MKRLRVACRRAADVGGIAEIEPDISTPRPIPMRRNGVDVDHDVNKHRLMQAILVAISIHRCQ